MLPGHGSGNGWAKRNCTPQYFLGWSTMAGMVFTYYDKPATNLIVALYIF